MIFPHGEAGQARASSGAEAPRAGIQTLMARRVTRHRSEKKMPSTQAYGPCGQVFRDVQSGRAEPGVPSKQLLI